MYICMYKLYKQRRRPNRAERLISLEQSRLRFAGVCRRRRPAPSTSDAVPTVYTGQILLTSLAHK